MEKSAELAKRMSKKKGTAKKVDEEDEDPYADDFVEPPVKKDDSWRGKHGRKKTAFLREAKGAVTPSKGDGFVLSPAFSPSSEPDKVPKSPEERASARKKAEQANKQERESAKKRREAELALREKERQRVMIEKLREKAYVG